jgi:hypothetical protein
MGNTSRRPTHGQPDRAYPSELVGSDSSGIGSNGGGVDSEPDCIDVELIQVDLIVQSTTKLGETAWLKNFDVHVHSGRLGNIPHILRAEFESHNYKTGKVVIIDVPTVRFCSKK